MGGLMLSRGCGVACGESYRTGPYPLAPARAGVQHMKPWGLSVRWP